jgi:hypothetical protein
MQSAPLAPDPINLVGNAIKVGSIGLVLNGDRVGGAAALMRRKNIPRAWW